MNGHFEVHKDQYPYTFNTKGGKDRWFVQHVPTLTELTPAGYSIDRARELAVKCNTLHEEGKTVQQVHSWVRGNP